MEENAPIIKNIVFAVEDKDLGVCLNCPRHKFHGPYKKDIKKGLVIGCKGSDELVRPRLDLVSCQDCNFYSWESKESLDEDNIVHELNPVLYIFA